MGRIALVNAPFTSHVDAMLRLADVLARHGHELIIWAPAEWRSRIEQLGATFEESAPELPRYTGPGLRAEQAEITENEAERLIPRLHAHDVDLLVRDSQTPWALVAAQYLGIPRIVSHPMFPMFPTPDPAADGKPDAAELRRFEQSWRSIARRWGVELTDVHGLHHNTPEPTLVFTTEEIVGDPRLPPSWQCIGPLLSPPPDPRPAGDRPLVYASFGTAQNRRTELFRTVIEALASEPVELLISTGGRSLGATELGPLPPNVIVREFVAAREVLASASVHVTHGGCNSVHESLIAGVPLVCLPQAFDQIPLSSRVAELGLGVIAAADSGSVRDAVLSMIGDDETRGRVEAMSERLQRYDGKARVAAAVAPWT